MKPKTQSKDIDTGETSLVSSRVKHTQWFFFAFCCYLLSQSITVPILPLGPWVIWPCLSDVAFIFLVLTFIKCHRYTVSPSILNQRIFSVLLMIFLGCLFSYFYYLLFADPNNKGYPFFGGFQIYRLVEFFGLFWLAARIPLTQARIEIMKHIVNGVLIFVCLGVFLTWANIIPLAAVTAHLPKVGAWQHYEGISKYGTEGLGFVGYNHAYVAAQIIMLFILVVHLETNPKNNLFKTFLLLLSFFSVFISESRSGFGAMLFLCLIYLIFKPLHALSIASLVCILLVLVPVIGLQSLDISSSDGSIIDRQLTVFEANKTENLSGRDQRWAAHLAALDENPINWIIGNGFGSAVDRGDNAHMLYLEIISETGLIGLGLFLFLFYLILVYSYKVEIKEKPFFWGTFVLLFTSFSQETFYPEPALGHFLGFYLSSLAIVLRTPYLGEDSFRKEI